jgi:hypothetical protein
MSGFFKLHRKIVDWEWFSDPKSLSLWIYILAKTNYEPKVYRGRQINRGQAVLGRKKASIDTGLTEQEIRTRLKRFQNSKKITSKSTSNFSIVTVLNYEKYQAWHDADQPVNQHGDNAQLTTSKKKEERKNITRTHARSLKPNTNCKTCDYNRPDFPCKNLSKEGFDPATCKAYKSIAELINLKGMR